MTDELDVYVKVSRHEKLNINNIERTEAREREATAFKKSIEEDILNRISEGREVIRPARWSDIDCESCEATGFGLASVDEALNKPPEYSDHYYIWAEGFSFLDVLDEFWDKYQSQAPYREGKLYWRLYPEICANSVFEREQKQFTIAARFHIVKHLLCD